MALLIRFIQNHCLKMVMDNLRDIHGFNEDKIQVISIISAYYETNLLLEEMSKRYSGN